uniref:Uncharacterized protein n=1 Tax=Physcomitrium patens TaxID=3218 RepID=A0A7I3Z1D3_PHYPA
MNMNKSLTLFPNKFGNLTSLTTLKIK